MTHVGQLVAYLHRRLGDSAAVYGEEIPDAVQQNLDQPAFDPVICVESRSSPMRGILTLEQLRFDIFCVAPSFDACHRLTAQLRDVMDDLSETGAGAPENVKSAVREAGPIPFRDAEKRRRTVHTSWLVFMSGDRPS